MEKEKKKKKRFMDLKHMIRFETMSFITPA